MQLGEDHLARILGKKRENAWKGAHLRFLYGEAIARELTSGPGNRILAKCSEGVLDRVATGITENF